MSHYEKPKGPITGTEARRVIHGAVVDKCKPHRKANIKSPEKHESKKSSSPNEYDP